MSNARRTSVILLAAALVALGLVGPVAAVAPARAAASPIAAKAGASSEPAATSALETRRSATLTMEAPLAAPDVEPAMPPSTRDGWSVLMTEGFEGAFPSPGWVAFDDDGATNGEYFWAPDDYKPHTGVKSAWPGKGGANGVDPNLYFYPNDMRSWMVYGPFDLSGRSQANLDFWYWNQSELNYDWFFWGQSGNGTDFDGTQVSGDSLGWQHVTLDLSASLGDSSVYVAFVFNSDFSNYDDGPFVDDVTLNAYSGAVTRDWTYMVYLDGDNNLEAAAVNDFLELSSVGSTARVAVVAQMDRITGWDTTYDNWTDTRRFYITAGMTPAQANGTSIGEVNMGAEATLVGFVQWAMTSYPAGRYALILWDHGSGWRSRALTDPLVQGIAYDDTSGGDGLSMPELRSALNTLTGGGANPFDLIGMDACLMALIEVDNQLRPYADVRVTSQEVEPNDGAPQDAILAALVANPAITTEALATVYVDQYYASYGNSQTQSAADLGADYATLNTAVNNFAAALLANGAANAAGIQAARTAVQDFDFDYYIDLYDFASRVGANVANTAIDNAAAAVMAALGPATVHEHHGAAWPGAHGLSIYFPKTLGEYDARYDGTSGFLQFTAATQWDEWLRAYYAYGSGPGPFGKTAPANGASGQAQSPTISWGTVAGVDHYAYCYDTTNDNVCDGISWIGNGTATSAQLTGLLPNTTYYWQVYASTPPGAPVYADGGTWWSFTTGASSVPNDDIGAATVIGGLPYTNTQNVADATTAPGDPGLPCASGSQKHHTVWYRYTSPTAQTIVADTFGSDFDTELAVWTGSPGSLTNVGCSEDWSGVQSRVEFNATAGTTYYIEAAAWNPAEPHHQLVLNVGAFAKTSPANGATGQPTNPTLSWGPSPSAVSYEYCYDMTNDAVCAGSWVSTGAATSASLNALSPGATYFWQARALYTWPGYSYANAGGWWSFTTAAAVSQEMTFRSVGTYDGLVIEQDETSGKGGSFDAASMVTGVGDNILDYQYRSILHFDTSGLPDGAVITGVTLQIKRQAIVGGNPFDSLGYLTVDQKTGAYHDNPALEKLDFHAVGSRGNVGRFIKTPSSGWYRAPLRSPSYGLVNLTGSTQFRLRFATDDNDNGVADYLSFYTGNAPEADRPQLIVTYYVP